MKSIALIAAVLALTSIAYTEDKSCPFAEIKPVKMGLYTLRISKLPEEQENEGYRCIATVVSRSGKTTTIAQGWALSFAVTGKDLNGDGIPDAVVEDYSGGAHCCWTYSFVSLGTQVNVFADIKNDRDLQIERGKSGHALLFTQDGAFDNFDGLCHACSPFPTVILELRGNRFYDVSSQFVTSYDKEIADARHELEKQPLQDFRELKKFDGSAQAEYQETIQPALSIVLAYLYSGREEQAWKEFSQMWPASDQERMKKLILETRATGFLAQINYSKHDSSHQTK